MPLQAQRLFGRSGMPLINALVRGAAGFRELGDEADRYRQISEKEARRAEEFIDSMTRLKEAVSGVGNALGAEMLPALIPAIDRMREWTVENRSEIVERLQTAVSDLAGMFSWIGGRIRDAVGALKGWHEWMSANIPFYNETIGKLAEWAGELGIVRGAAILLGVWLGKGLLMAIIGLFRPLVMLGWYIALAFAKTLWWAGGKALVTYLWGLAVTHVPKALKALRALAAATLFNPLVLAIVGLIALVGFLGYTSPSGRHRLRQRRAVRHHRAVPIRERHVLVDHAPMGGGEGSGRRRRVARRSGGVGRLRPVRHAHRMVVGHRDGVP